MTLRKAGQTKMTLMQDKYPAFLYRVCFRVMFVCPAFLQTVGSERLSL